jgi:ribonuclease Y
MEIVLAALVAAVVGGGVVLAVTRRSRGPAASESRDSTPGDERARESATETGTGATTRGAATAARRGTAARQADLDGAGLGEDDRTAIALGGDGRTAPGLRAAADSDRREVPVAAAADAVVGGRAQPGRAAAEPPPRRERAPAPAADDAEVELRARRSEIARTEERILGKEQSLEARLGELARREQSLEDRARNLDRDAQGLKAAKREHVRELERIANLSAGQAKQILVREIEDEMKHERARLIRQAEEEARRDAERRTRSILSACMQRLASGHAAETTVSVVSLESDELKGRIIGREGRNIRSLETLTGIDIIVDDTPGTVVLSGFDGVRREIARLTLERLLQDGRIHPARIEESYEQSRSEIEDRIMEVGEQAVFDARVGALDPELVKLLGRLHYRTSYGQNVLAHSIECAHLAAMLSEELGASSKTARRAALLHDIGKAVSHEVEGPHALVGGRLARRHRESEAVAHAMEAHHNEVDMQTIEAVVVQVADSLSGARPGARGASLEQYTKRLHDLEEIAKRHPGVDRVYAMQAGREIRVIVRPEDVDDDTAAILSHEIARDVERELEYGGQIKVTVIRESRAVDYAR